MKSSEIPISWPNGIKSIAKEGDEWIIEAEKVGLDIPTGCLRGSCGACEIEVNGKVIRSCISKIKDSKSEELNVEFVYDPFW
tara:strand:+ start:245 stop:490 length:246 start_codon:yes stop_codon:yes gene_type:complete